LRNSRELEHARNARDGWRLWRRDSLPPPKKRCASIIGSELTMEDGTILPVLVETRTGYQNLCGFPQAKLRA
jgi:hypothetical protein